MESTTGCTKVSPGCKHCYAEVMARRLHAMGAPGYANEFQLTVHENRLEQPLLRNKPTTYFVNSMSDLFHEAVPDKFLDGVFSIIQATPHHTYKSSPSALSACGYFARRAARRTCGWACQWRTRSTACRASTTCARWKRTSASSRSSRCWRTWAVSLRDIHWVIVGGESGHKARPMREEWVTTCRCRLMPPVRRSSSSSGEVGAQTASSTQKQTVAS